MIKNDQKWSKMIKNDQKIIKFKFEKQMWFLKILGLDFYLILKSTKSDKNDQNQSKMMKNNRKWWKNDQKRSIIDQFLK